MTDEQLYDHYKDSFEQQKAYIHNRDKYTVYLLIGIFLFVCVLVNPKQMTDYVNAYVQQSYDKITFDFSLLNSFLLYVVLWIVLQYYQTCLTIEKGYDYLWELESKLGIFREGEFYASKYPALKNVANFFYTWCIPIGMAALSIIKIIREVKLDGCNIAIDHIALTVICIFSLLYFSDRSLEWSFFLSSKHKGIGLWNRLKGFVKLDVDDKME